MIFIFKFISAKGFKGMIDGMCEISLHGIEYKDMLSSCRSINSTRVYFPVVFVIVRSCSTVQVRK